MTAKHFLLPTVSVGPRPPWRTARQLLEPPREAITVLAPFGELVLVLVWPWFGRGLVLVLVLAWGFGVGLGVDVGVRFWFWFSLGFVWFGLVWE